MLKKLSVIAASLLLCAGIVNAETVKPAAGWAMSDDYDKAMEFAKKTGKPIAVLFALKESTCPIHNGAVESVYMDKSLAAMVKVVIYDDNMAKISSIQNQGDTSKIKYPTLYLTDSEGRLTAQVDPSKENQIKPEAAKVTQLASWEVTSKKQIEKFDKDAAAGKFKAALKGIAKIEEQDSTVTAAVTVGASTTEKKEAVKISDKSAAKESSDTKAPGRYFPNLLSTKREAYEAIAAEKLKLAKEKFEAKDLVGGRKLISVMVADGSDLDSVKEAAALMKESVASAK